MNLGAQSTNRVINLAEKPKIKSKLNPSIVEAARLCMKNLKHFLFSLLVATVRKFIF